MPRANATSSPAPRAAESSSLEDARALSDIVARFRARHVDDWEALRLCPLQHGLETMKRKLRAYR